MAPSAFCEDDRSVYRAEPPHERDGSSPIAATPNNYMTYITCDIYQKSLGYEVPQGETHVRNSPVLTVDVLDDPSRSQVEAAVEDAKKDGTIDLNSLPQDVRAQVFFALDALAHGRSVAALITDGKPLTTTEAAEALGMSRSHLQQLCDEGRIPSYRVGTSRRIDADVVLQILQARARARQEARAAGESSDARRRARAARAVDR